MLYFYWLGWKPNAYENKCSEHLLCARQLTPCQIICTITCFNGCFPHLRSHACMGKGCARLAHLCTPYLAPGRLSKILQNRGGAEKGSTPAWNQGLSRWWGEPEGGSVPLVLAGPAAHHCLRQSSNWKSRWQLPGGDLPCPGPRRGPSMLACLRYSLVPRPYSITC